MTTLAVEISDDVRRRLEAEASAQGVPIERLVAEWLRRMVTLRSLRELQHELGPKAEAMGLRTDEDIFRAIS